MNLALKRYRAKPEVKRQRAAYQQAWRYGLTVAQLAELHQKFGKQCAICGNEKPLCVDHCHTTNKIRGLICRTCNAGLGLFKDNPEIVAKALQYLSDSVVKSSD